MKEKICTLWTLSTARYHVCGIVYHFAKYRFSFRKVQISISQSTDFHFAKYRFHFVSFRFAKYHFAKYNKPFKTYPIEGFGNLFRMLSPCGSLQHLSFARSSFLTKPSADSNLMVTPWNIPVCRVSDQQIMIQVDPIHLTKNIVDKVKTWSWWLAISAPVDHLNSPILYNQEVT